MKAMWQRLGRKWHILSVTLAWAVLVEPREELERDICIDE